MFAPSLKNKLRLANGGLKKCLPGSFMAADRHLDWHGQHSELSLHTMGAPLHPAVCQLTPTAQLQLKSHVGQLRTAQAQSYAGRLWVRLDAACLQAAYCCVDATRKQLWQSWGGR
jgi:hypothetical protein